MLDYYYVEKQADNYQAMCETFVHINSDLATLSQVSDYRLLGASGLFTFFTYLAECLHLNIIFYFWALLQLAVESGHVSIIEGSRANCNSLCDLHVEWLSHRQLYFICR